MSRSRTKELKTWTAFFESVRDKLPDTTSQDYSDGVEEARTLVALVKAQVEEFKALPNRNAFHPRRGSIRFHLHAFRHGFNNFFIKKAQKASSPELVAGLFADVYGDVETKEYDRGALLKNETMVHAGRAFAAMVVAREDEKARTDLLWGFRTVLDEFETPAEASSSAEADKMVLIPSEAVRPVDKTSHLGEGLPSSEFPGREIISDSGVDVSGLNFGDFDQPVTDFQYRVLRRFAVMKTQEESPPVTIVESLEMDARALVKDEATKNRIDTIVMDLIKLESIKNFERLRGADAAFVRGYGAAENYYEARIDAIFRLERARIYEKEDLDKELETVDDNAMLLSEDESMFIFRMGFDGGLNGYFDSWRSATKRITDDRLLDSIGKPPATLEELKATPDNVSKIELQNLRHPIVIIGLFKMWCERRGIALPDPTPRPDDVPVEKFIDPAIIAHPMYTGFSYFVDAGITAAMDFMRSFIQGEAVGMGGKPATYDKSWLFFCWFYLGWLSCMDPAPVTPTTHFKSLMSKYVHLHRERTSMTEKMVDAPRFTDEQNAAVVPKQAFLRMLLRRRPTSMLLRVLDMDYDTFMHASAHNGQALDILNVLIDDGFIVDANTGSVVTNASEEVQLTWEMRVLRSCFVASLSSRVMHPLYTGKMNANDFKHRVTNMAAQDYRFYVALAKFAQEFDADAYAELKTNFSKYLPSTLRKASTAPLYVRYAMIVDHQMTNWFERSRNMFDERNFDSQAWPFIQKLWQMDNCPIEDGSYLHKMARETFVRVVGAEKNLYRRRQRLILGLAYPIDLPFAKEEDLLISELLATIYRLHAAADADTMKAIGDIRSAALTGNESAGEKTTETISRLFNGIWSGRHDDASMWTTEEEQDDLLKQLQTIKPTQADLETFDRPVRSLALGVIAGLPSLVELSTNKAAVISVLLSAYTAEMYINCNIALSEIIHRNWRQITTFGDVHVLKEDLLQTPAGKLAYAQFVMAMTAGDVASGVDVSLFAKKATVDNTEVSDDEDEEYEDEQEEEEEDSSSSSEALSNSAIDEQVEAFGSGRRDFTDNEEQAVDDEEEEGSSEPPLDSDQSGSTQPLEEEAEPYVAPVARTRPRAEEPPAKPKRARPAASEPAGEEAPVFDVSAAGKYHGELYALSTEAGSIDSDTLLNNENVSLAHEHGEAAGIAFANALRRFTAGQYGRDAGVKKFKVVRAYAINQLSNVYNELAKANVGGMLWDKDFSNKIPVQREIEMARRLLALTEPMARTIHDAGATRAAYMRGFLEGYEHKVATLIQHMGVKPISAKIEASSDVVVITSVENANELLAQAPINALVFSGDKITDDVLESILPNIAATHLVFEDTLVYDLAAVLNNVHGVKALEYKGTKNSGANIEAALLTEHALTSLEAIRIDFAPSFDDEDYNAGMAAIGRYLGDAISLRQVDLHLGDVEENARVLEAIRAGVEASSTIQVFHCNALADVKPRGLIGARHHGGLSRAKAKQMLADNSAHGHPLTDKQHRYFEWIAHRH